LIIEMRTYDLQPGTVPQYEKHFAEALPRRMEYSRLGAFWRTEIGPLNRIIQVWPYESLEKREGILGKANAGGAWPPAGEELILARKVRFWRLRPFRLP